MGYSLGEILGKKGYIRGPFGSALKRSEMLDKGIPVYEQQNAIYNHREFRFFISNDKFEEMKRFTVQEGDIIISCSGTVGKTTMIRANDPIGIISQALLILRPDKKKTDSRFLKYFLDSKEGQEGLLARAHGSVQTNIAKRQDVETLVIPELSLAHQKSVANILSSLDDKIELNNKINKNLEELAQTLYKQWFVDFEFPNEDGQPYKSSGGEIVESELGLIPKGWEISNLLDIADYLNGLAVKKFAANDDELSLPVLKIKELGIGNVTAESDRCNLSVPEKYIIKKGDLIFSWSGTLLVDFWTGSKSVLNQHLFKVSSTKYPRWFYYFWTKYHLGKFQNIAKSMATTMGHIKREDLSKSQVFIPIKDLLEQGSSIFEPIIDQILKLRIQNNKLMKVRDGLLPKLMNGEIEVPIEE